MLGGLPGELDRGGQALWLPKALLAQMWPRAWVFYEAAVVPVFSLVAADPSSDALCLPWLT